RQQKALRPLRILKMLVLNFARNRAISIRYENFGYQFFTAFFADPTKHSLVPIRLYHCSGVRGLLDIRKKNPAVAAAGRCHAVFPAVSPGRTMCLAREPTRPRQACQYSLVDRSFTC